VLFKRLNDGIPSLCTPKTTEVMNMYNVIIGRRTV